MDLTIRDACSERICGAGPGGAAAAVFRPAARGKAMLYDLALVLGGSLLLGISAQVVIPLPMVPLTGQTFAVLLLGALLGSRLGACTVLAYLAEGAAGLPVFSEARGGAAMLAGPTGGYLVGFLFAAALVGFLAERGWDRRVLSTVAAMLLGNVVLYGTGLAWLTCLAGMRTALAIGLYPFLLGEVVKVGLAAAILPLGWRMLAGLQSRTRASGRA